MIVYFKTIDVDMSIILLTNISYYNLINKYTHIVTIINNLYNNNDSKIQQKT